MERREVRDDSAGRPGARQAAAARAGWMAFAGYLLIAASIATIVIGASHANKPHEVRGEGLFYLLQAIQAGISLLLLFLLGRVWHLRRLESLRAVHWLAVCLAASYAGLGLYFFGRLGWAYLD